MNTYQLHHDAQWLDTFNVAGKVSTNTESDPGPPFHVAVNTQRLLEVEAVRKHQLLALGIDPQRFVALDAHVSPGKRAA
ncbi:hypothetical protein D3C72_1111370 [compost metagenome]